MVFKYPDGSTLEENLIVIGINFYRVLRFGHLRCGNESGKDQQSRRDHVKIGSHVYLWGQGIIKPGNVPYAFADRVKVSLQVTN
ncbi:MAG TPA: hypothetical protein VK582_17125 [Pyrinomonadaceae bacterium]|nr:hypothetical protein [Pyrinomonadaceae bacterium]